jgi:hypothetical protein
MLLKRAVLIALALVGCNPCTSDHLRGGDTPFSRCIQRDPGNLPERVGAVTLRAEGRLLILEGLPAEPRIAAFQAPGMTTAADPSPVLRKLGGAKPDILLVLGGLGLDTLAAKQHLARLAGLTLPVLFLAGGRDSSEVFEQAHEALPEKQRGNVVDVTGFHQLRLAGYSLVLVAGSENGRSAIHESACGFTPEDLERIEDAAKPPPETHRVLVSWEIPTGSPVASVTAGDVGAPGLGALRDTLGPRFGVHAWPDVHVMRPQSGQAEVVSWDSVATDLHLVVPRLYGPSHELGDGTRHLPGYAILRFGKGGLTVERPR